MSPQGACKGGDTTTAGGLVFSSANHGEFFAYDAKTGKELWHFKGPENVWAAPVVYEAEGKEYVAIYYGGQVGPNGGMTERHNTSMLVFSVEAEALPMWTQLEEVIVGLQGLSLTVDAVREALGEDDEDGGGEEDGVREPRDPPPRGGLAFEEIDSPLEPVQSPSVEPPQIPPPISSRIGDG